MRQFRSRQFLAFVVTGGLAACVNFGSRILYNQWIDFSSAVIAAYITGMVTAFVLARVFVFTQGGQALHRSLLYFCLVNVLAISQTWLISMGLAYYVLPWLGVSRFSHEIAHVMGVMAPVFTSYLGHKHWTFR